MRAGRFDSLGGRKKGTDKDDKEPGACGVGGRRRKGGGFRGIVVEDQRGAQAISKSRLRAKSVLYSLPRYRGPKVAQRGQGERKGKERVRSSRFDGKKVRPPHHTGGGRRV